jgi:hypothetical protein
MAAAAAAIKAPANGSSNPGLSDTKLLGLVVKALGYVAA